MYVFLSFRPIKSNEVRVRSGAAYENVGIIVQGPLIERDNLTYETLLIYKKIFPGSKIILSTWINESHALIEKFLKLGVEIVLSEPPKTPGWGNINMQMCSVNAALNKAHELGLGYAMKTRTDFRIYSSSAISFLLALIKHFQRSNENRKIIISNFGTCRHRVYGATDIFQFGELSDMRLYWSGGGWEEELARHFKDEILVNGTPLVCEIFLCARYLKQMGRKLNFNLDCWWAALVEYFIVVDLQSIDAVFLKYDYAIEQRFIRTYSEDYSRSINFSDWLGMYSGQIQSWTTDFGKGAKEFRETWALDSKGHLQQLIR